jgi:hypothetical protein
MIESCEHCDERIGRDDRVVQAMQSVTVDTDEGPRNIEKARLYSSSSHIGPPSTSTGGMR